MPAKKPKTTAKKKPVAKTSSKPKVSPILPPSGKPTPAAIAKEIAALTELKPRVRKTTMFGDDNHKAIDAQLEVLRTDMRESKIADTYNEDTDGDLDEQREQGRTEAIYDAAMDARRWLDDASKSAPSADWGTAVRD